MKIKELLFTHYYNDKKTLDNYYNLVSKKKNHPLNLIRYLISAELVNSRDENYNLIFNSLDNLITKNSNGIFFTYNFDFNLHKSGDIMKSPWISSMSQSEGLILYILLYIKTNDNHYLDIIKGIRNSYLYIKDVNNKYETYDDLWFVVKDNDNYIWLEEYPLNINNKFIHALNGYIFGLQGLFVYLELYPNDNQIINLVDELLKTLRDNLYKFIPDNGVTYYSLYHKAQSERYHRIHIRQLKMLFNITNNRVFDTYYHKFKKTKLLLDSEAKNNLTLLNNRSLNLILFLYKKLDLNLLLTNKLVKTIFIYSDKYSKTNCLFRDCFKQSKIIKTFVNIFNIDIDINIFNSQVSYNFLKNKSKSKYKQFMDVSNDKLNVNIFNFGEYNSVYIYYYESDITQNL